MTDAKEMWEAIKSRFGGNDESENMQKYILKQQFEGFSASPLKMQIRSSLGSTAHPLQPEVAFVSENTSSTNEVSTAYGVSNSSGHNSQKKIRFMKIDLDDKTDVLTYHKKLLAEAEKEKEELKAKIEKWHNSSKSLNILLNSQMSARDKAELGYGDQMNKGVLSYENKVFGCLFDSRSSDIEDSYVNNRYKGMLQFPSNDRINILLDLIKIRDPQFTYGPKQSKPSESDARSSDFTSCESNSSEETHESMPESVVNEPKVVSQPKVWTDAPIIEEYESDSDDEHVSLPSKEQETPSFANTIKHVKTPRQTVKQQNTCSKSPKPDKKDYSVHLIRDLDFHEKRMAKQAEVNKRKCKGTGQRENRPVWNNVNRVNHQNQFVPTAVLTRTGKIQVNTARASSTNNVNTVRASSTKNVSTARHNFNSQAVPTNAVRNAVGGKWEIAVKPSEGCNWRPKRNYWNKVSKYNGGSNSRNYVTFKDPLGRPKPKMAWEDQPESQPDHLSRPFSFIPFLDSIQRVSGWETWRSTIQAKKIKRLKHKIKSCKRRPDLRSLYPKQGRKTAKSKPTTHKDQAFDDPDDFGPIDYMETEDAHNEKGVSIEDQVNTIKPDEGTDKPKVSTNKIDKGTTELKNGNSDENATPTATLTIFGDDETITEFLLANDEEIARKVQEEWETEEEKKKLAEVKATKAALIRDYDDIQARIEVDSILAARLQEEERGKFTIKERAKLLPDTIAAQRRFLAQQRAAEVRKLQVLYEKVKRFDENFIAIGSAEDKRIKKDVNKKATGTKKDDSIKEERKEEENTSQDDNTNSEKENDELRLCLTIAPDEDKRVDYEILNKKYPIIEWKTEYLETKPQFGETKRLEEINLNVVIRGNGQRRYFSTMMRVLSIFNKEDINVVYQLVMDKYQDEIPEGFDRVLWGDLMIMFNPSDEDEFWNSQQDWNVVSWKLHGSSGVHTLMTEAGLVIHMLVEKKYHLRRKVLLQMLELKLESQEDSTMALELIRFVKKLIAELEPEDSDGNEEDL
ncbi:hypothetical protein Tco_0644481 [Tanacetum coccineum]